MEEALSSPKRRGKGMKMTKRRIFIPGGTGFLCNGGVSLDREKKPLEEGARSLSHGSTQIQGLSTPGEK